MIATANREYVRRRRKCKEI